MPFRRAVTLSTVFGRILRNIGGILRNKLNINRPYVCIVAFRPRNNNRPYLCIVAFRTCYLEGVL